MAKSTVIICIDGFDPAYVEGCDGPVMARLARDGFHTYGRAMMPTVTNVNNVSMVTASYPEVHGITSNYRFDRQTGREYYMESTDDILAETIFQRARRLGATSLLVTSKDKLRTLLGDGSTRNISSEKPEDWVVKGVGEAPPIYSLEVNGWIVDAACYAMSKAHSDVVYIASTDFAMHTYPPSDEHSQQHISLLDKAIGRLLDAHPDCQVLITADHGMSPKTNMVDVESILKKEGITASAVPVIKDRYTVHHSNLGGSIYVYVSGGQVEDAVAVLRQTPGVDDALAREEAAARFHLKADRIGDIFVLGAADTVFGSPSQVEIPPNLRSHGSLHEEQVPIIGWGGDFQGFDFHENRDVGRYVMERVLT